MKYDGKSGNFQIWYQKYIKLKNFISAMFGNECTYSNQIMQIFPYQLMEMYEKAK